MNTEKPGLSLLGKQRVCTAVLGRQSQDVSAVWAKVIERDKEESGKLATWLTFDDFPNNSSFFGNQFADGRF